MKVRINRKKWMRGCKAPNGTNLYSARLWLQKFNCGCCLGHAVRQEMHCAWSKLENKAFPDHVKGDSVFASFQTEAADINDTTKISNEERESKLIALFKNNGHELEFYN